MNEKMKLGLVGLGQRGNLLLQDVLVYQEDIEITALCDVYEDRCEDCVKILRDHGKKPKLVTKDYKEVIACADVDTILVTAAWEAHFPISIEALQAGKNVGMEVGGSYSINECWQLVRAAEQSSGVFAFMENCCYGRNELLVLNMVRQGLFGEIVHCSGGYRHDLRDEISRGRENRHYRFQNYLHRCCDNYPTHELGPIMSVLDINHGNRILSLVSMASKARGLHEFIEKDKGDSCDAAHFHFCQGDVVTTMLKCANGETITLTLDTSLPRYYSRAFHVQGTKGMYEDENKSILLDGAEEAFRENWQPRWGNVEEYRQYDHPIWKEYESSGVMGGHGGADWLEIRAFAGACREGRSLPLDVYDAATLMAVTSLSEESIALGSQPVAMPDFTSGKWIHRKRWEP